MTIKVTVIDVLGRRIEARTATHHTFPSLFLAFLPLIYKALVNTGIERDDRERGLFGKFTQLGEKSGEHLV